MLCLLSIADGVHIGRARIRVEHRNPSSQIIPELERRLRVKVSAGIWVDTHDVLDVQLGFHTRVVGVVGSNDTRNGTGVVAGLILLEELIQVSRAVVLSLELSDGLSGVEIGVGEISDIVASTQIVWTNQRSILNAERSLLGSRKMVDARHKVNGVLEMAGVCVCVVRVETYNWRRQDYYLGIL